MITSYPSIEVSWLSEWLVMLWIKSMVYLLIVSCVVYLMRSRSAAFREAIWRWGCVGLLVLPFTGLWAPQWNLSLAKSESLEAMGQGWSVKTWLSSEVTGVSAEGSRTSTETDGALDQAEGGARVPWIEFWFLTLVLWLLKGLPIFYGLGSLLILSRMIVATWKVRRIRERSKPFDSREWIQTVEALRLEMNFHRPVRLLDGGEGVVPMTYTMEKPTIMLPMEARDWHAGKRLSVLRHEMAHLQRRDGVARWLAWFATALHWMNPLAWFALNRLHLEQEQACDDCAVRGDVSAEEYGSWLLEIGRSSHRRSLGMAAMAMARTGQLESRLKSLLNKRSRRQPVTRSVVVTLAIFITGFASLLGSLQLSSSSDTPSTHPVSAGEGQNILEPPNQLQPTSQEPFNGFAQVSEISGKETREPSTDRKPSSLPQVLLEIKLVESRVEGTPSSGFTFQVDGSTNQPDSDSTAGSVIKENHGTLKGILTEPQFRELFTAMERQPGTRVISTPRVVTLSGRQASISATTKEVLPTLGLPGKEAGEGRGIEIEVGPVFDLIPTVAPDEVTVDLLVVAFIHQLSKRDLSNQDGRQSSQQQFTLNTFEANARVRVFDGQTLVMGGWIFADDQGKKRLLTLFVTPTLLDPAGNRIRDEIQTEIPSQSTPSASGKPLESQGGMFPAIPVQQ